MAHAYEVGSARVPLEKGGGAAFKFLSDVINCQKSILSDRTVKHSNRTLKHFYETIKYFLCNVALKFNAGICMRTACFEIVCNINFTNVL